MAQIDKEQLETMVVDIFDELSRRSVEEEWQASTTAEERKTTIPALFLPVIEGLSQERLQVHMNCVYFVHINTHMLGAIYFRSSNHVRGP